MRQQPNKEVGKAKLKNMEQTEGQEAQLPHKTWFIQRGDGFVFAARENEAWELLKNRTNWMRKDFKIIGVSDGLTFHKVLKEGKRQIPVIQAEIDEIQKEITEYSKTEHTLKYVDLIDETDERLIKIKSLKKVLSDKLFKKIEEKNSLVLELDKKAFEAELEVAKGHIEMPSNQDVFAPKGSKEKILQALLLPQ